MITIFEDRFISIYFEDAQKLFISKWSANSADITMEEIKSEVLNGVELILKHKPQFYLSDNRNQEFIFEVKIQNWLATTILTPCIQVGTKKFAILMPDDMIAELSLEQSAEEAIGLPIEIKYFKNEEDALKWFGI